MESTEELITPHAAKVPADIAPLSAKRFFSVRAKMAERPKYRDIIIVGTTGKGKSSPINCLLKVFDLASASSQDRGTFVCTYSKNAPQDQSAPYAAQVFFMRGDELRREIVSLLDAFCGGNSQALEQEADAAPDQITADDKKRGAQECFEHVLVSSNLVRRSGSVADLLKRVAADTSPNGRRNAVDAILLDVQAVMEQELGFEAATEPFLATI
jgi:hypothetical protein